MLHYPTRYRLATTVWLGLLSTLARPALRRQGHLWGAGTLLLLAGGQPRLVQAQAPVTVSGRVQDEISGESLLGATVRVVEQPGVGTGVAASGAFTLTLPAGTYTLEASFLGYKTAVRRVVLTRNQRVSFQLARTEASLAEVVVTARRRDATISKAQAGVETLDMRQIAKVPVLFGVLLNK